MADEGEGQVAGDGAEGAEGAAAAAEDGGEPAPEPRSVASAIEEARGRMERGEPIVPGGDDDPDDEEEDDAEAEPVEGDEAAEEEGEGEEAEPAPEGADASDEEAEDEGGEEEEVEEEEGEEEEAELAVAVLPGRGPDDPDIEIEVPAELQEDFNRLRNGYMRGEEFRRRESALEETASKLATDQEELQGIDRALEEDPVGFVLERVRTELRVDLLRSLLADDEVWEDEQLQQELQGWEHDPDKRKLFAERSKRERLEKRQSLSEEQRIRREMREGAAETARTVKQLVPEDWAPEKVTKFWNLAMKTLGEAARGRASSRFSQDEVITMLDNAGILEGYGIDPQAARTSDPEEGSDRTGAREHGKKKGARRTRPAARRKAVTPEEAQGTGKRLKDQSRKRKAAAAYAPAGAGAPAAATELPKGQSVKERIATVRKLGGISRVIGRG